MSQSNTKPISHVMHEASRSLLPTSQDHEALHRYADALRSFVAADEAHEKAWALRCLAERYSRHATAMEIARNQIADRRGEPRRPPDEVLNAPSIREACRVFDEVSAAYLHAEAVAAAARRALPEMFRRPVDPEHYAGVRHMHKAARAEGRWWAEMSGAAVEDGMGEPVVVVETAFRQRIEAACVYLDIDS